MLQDQGPLVVRRPQRQPMAGTPAGPTAVFRLQRQLMVEAPAMGWSQKIPLMRVLWPPGVKMRKRQTMIHAPGQPPAVRRWRERWVIRAPEPAGIGSESIQ
jgi:hypothetical protein